MTMRQDLVATVATRVRPFRPADVARVDATRTRLRAGEGDRAA